MNKKEIAEIKKQYSVKNCSIDRIAGCVVKDGSEICSVFQKNFLNQSEEEICYYFELLKKGFCGKIDQKLFHFEFDRNDHGMYSQKLENVLNSKLKNEEVLNDFYTNIVKNYTAIKDYAIFVVYGAYDIPNASSSVDGNLEDDSDNVYEFIQVIICPIALDKAALSCQNNEIKYKIGGQLIAPPMTSILYPSFDDRSPNKNAMLYYSKKANELQEMFLENMFHITQISTSLDQKNAIATAMEVAEVTMNNVIALKEKCEELDVENENVKLDIKSVEKLCDACNISTDYIANSLKEMGIQEVNFENVFPKNKTIIKTDNVSIQLNKESLDKISIQKIDGANCIVIHPDGRIRVDDIPVREF